MIAGLVLSAGVSLTGGTMVDFGVQSHFSPANRTWAGMGVEGSVQFLYARAVVGVSLGFVPAFYGPDIDFRKHLARADVSLLLSTMARFGADEPVEHRLGIGLLLAGSWDISGETGPYYYYQPAARGRVGLAAGYELSVRVGSYRVAGAIWGAVNPFGLSVDHTFLVFYSGTLRVKVEFPM